MKRDAKEICLSNNITDDDLRNVCKRYFVKEGRDFEKFWINRIEFEDFSSKNFGFLGLHLKLTITLSPKNIFFDDESEFKPIEHEDQEDITFFVKIFPIGNNGQAGYIREMHIFEKETDLYQFMIPRLQNMALGSKKWAAESYLCKDEKVLILEDLRVKGFKVASNSELGIFDLDHLLVAGTLLGRFHASSMLLENQNRKTIPEMYPSTLTENAYPDIEDSIRMTGLNNAIAAYQNIISLIPKYQSNSYVLEKINAELPIKIKRIIEFAKTSTVFRNVFCHGDLWANNFLFLYQTKDDSSDDAFSEYKTCVNEEIVLDIKQGKATDKTENGFTEIQQEGGQPRSAKEVLGGPNQLKPLDARLVDFQLARYAPPALDLMTLMFMTSSQAFRQRYFKDICENYYESLRIELERLGLDANYELPKEQFWESIAYYKLAGMIECLLFSHLTLLPETQTDKMFSKSEEFGQFIRDASKRSEVCVDVFTCDIQYRVRITEIVTELVDTYILEEKP